jgi:hypothetical protein
MAAHGDIRWPPVGSSDGRLRGEFHGRRHCRGAALSGAQFGVHRGVRAAWSHTCGGWIGLRQSARAVGGRRGRVNGNRDADRTCGGRVQDRGGAAFRKPSSAMANTRSRQCRSRVLPRSLPLPILDSPPFRVAGAAIVIAALAAAAYVFLVSPLARHQAQRQGAALAPAIATVIGFTFALGLAGNALDGANDLQQGAARAHSSSAYRHPGERRLRALHGRAPARPARSGPRTACCTSEKPAGPLCSMTLVAAC